MRKKIILLVFVLLVCTQLTGCGPFDKLMDQAKNICAGLQTGDLKDTAAKDNMFPMTKKTRKAQNKALKSADKASELSDRAATTSFPATLLPKNWFLETRANKASIKANSALDSYETAKAKDDTWIKARKEAGLDGANSTFKWSKYGWVVGLVACVILFIILTLVFNSIRKSKAKLKTAKAKEQAARNNNLTVIEQAPKPALTGAPRPALVDRSDQKSVQQCMQYCDKFGIDYNTMLAKYGGDPKKLLDVLVVSRKEDFH